MNLLFIDLHCDASLPAGAGEFGGGNTYSRSVLELISNNDEINCIYVTRKKSKELEDFFKFSKNIKYFRIRIGDYCYNDKDSLYLYTESTVKAVSKILNAQKFVPEIIHSSYWPSGLVALEISKNYCVKQIHTVLSNGKRKAIESGNYSIEHIRTNSEQTIYDNVDYIVCSSKSEYEDINKLYNISTEKLVLTGLDVSDAFRFPSYWKDGSVSLTDFGNERTYLNMLNSSNSFTDNYHWWNDGAFVYFGRLHEDKGVLQIIQCWLELYKKFDDFPSLWIAGGTPEQILHFREKVNDTDVLNFAEQQGKLIWWGRLSSEGISTLLLKSIAVITHSKYEAGGLMVLESMASAKPVVATPNGFAKDCIKNWENGFLVNYNFINGLKLRLTNFYLQPLLSSKLGNNALNTFLTIDRKYDFRNGHLSLYNIDKSQDIQCINHDIIPYPLYELLPTEKETLNVFYNIYSENNNINYKDLTISQKCNNTSHIIWELSFSGKVFYCIRWKNHCNDNSIFFKNDKNFYTSFEQYNLNKLFLKNNNKYEKYFDDTHRLIFINSNNKCLRILGDNYFEVDYSKYTSIKGIQKYTYKSIIKETIDMLTYYDFLFNKCEKHIRNILEITEKNLLSHREFQMFPKNIYNSYIIGKELIFVNELVLVEKDYINKDKLDNKFLNVLIRCHDLMRRGIIEGEIDIDTFIELLNILK